MKLLETKDDRSLDEISSSIKKHYENAEAVRCWSDYDSEKGRRELARIKQSIPLRRRSVLDVGTGTGRFAVEAAKMGAKVSGADLSLPMLREAHKRANQNNVGLYVVQTNGAALPFKDNSFDIVSCLQTIHVMASPRIAILEFSRVLRPGGILIISTVNAISLTGFFGTVLPFLLKKLLRLPVNRSLLTSFGIKSFLLRSGFLMKEMESYDLFGLDAKVPLGHGRSLRLLPARIERLFLRFETALNMGKPFFRDFMHFILVISLKAH